MSGADENLRYRASPVRPRAHRLARLRIPGDIDFIEADTFARKKFLRPVTIGTKLLRVDFYGSHKSALILSPQHFIWTFAPDRQPWRIPAHRRSPRRRAKAPAHSPRPARGTRPGYWRPAQAATARPAGQWPSRASALTRLPARRSAKKQPLPAFPIG